MRNYEAYERERKMRLRSGGRKEILFKDGIPERSERKNRGDTFIYPEDIIGKTCGECVRFGKRDHGKLEGYHCSMRSWDIDVFPDSKACVAYWDRAEHERAELQHQQDVENRRKELWAIYSKIEPIKLPIINDGFGVIPECPVCGEMPYDTEQCHWCGQRFIQDEKNEEYNTPLTEEYKCPSCGTVGTAHRSRYNGHRHFKCEKCGFGFME